MYPPAGQNAAWALMNESGSGVTVEVMQLNLLPVGPFLSSIGSTISLATHTPYVRFSRFAYMDDTTASGNDVTPIPHSSAFGTPQYLDIKSGSFYEPLTPTLVAGINPWMDLSYGTTLASVGPYRRINSFGGRIMQAGNHFSAPSSIQSITGWSEWRPLSGFDYHGENIDPIILRRGQGFAVLASTSSGYTGFVIRASITEIERAEYYSYD